MYKKLNSEVLYKLLFFSKLPVDRVESKARPSFSVKVKTLLIEQFSGLKDLFQQ